MDILFDTRSPVYEQIKKKFKEALVSGEFQLGQEIPSRRDLATQLGVNPNTVQRAYKEMEAMNWIVTDGNVVSRVTTDEQVILHLREEMMANAINDFIQTMQLLKLPKEKVFETLTQLYGKTES